MKIARWFFLLITVLFVSCNNENSIQIVYLDGADKQIELAAKELQRYIYVRSGKIPDIKTVGDYNQHKSSSIVLMTSDEYNGSSLEFKTGQDYYLLSQSNPDAVFIIGASPVAVLYGAYQYIETALGIEFELQGDIIPDDRIAEIPLQGFDKMYSPSFNLRGIQPFHDFPEGPDYWTAEDYQSVITQLAKMRMNFIGFHTYPEKEPFGGWDRAEPNVWIGSPGEFNPDGTVTAAYPALHANTNDSTWEYFPVMTSEYSFGANQLYDTDVFGTDFMKNTSKWPHTTEENIHIFNSMGKLLNNTFTWARELGIKTCLGTEIPVTIPNQVKARLIEKGQNPGSPDTRKEIYKGIFSRIMSTHPLDYYWFWTPEGWTWEGEDKAAVAATEADLMLAQQAIEEVKAPFQLATCGWVLGPAHDRTAFDKLLPKSWPFSCINREQGFTPVEPGFQAIQGRPKWQISWIEDDPALTTPQLWAGRVRKDAVDAYKYGCDGFMGIHWRTMGLSPIFKSLVSAGWETAGFNRELGEEDRDYPVDDLYYDWAEAWFGKEAGKQIAGIFIQKDGGHLYKAGLNARTGKLPRPAEWGFKGPGTIVVNHQPWEEVKEQYTFVDEIANLRASVKGAGNLYRFDYWLNSFLYMKTMGEVGCMLGELENRIEAAGKNTESAKEILGLRNAIDVKWGEMMGYLLQTVNTKGEMGTVSNMEEHNLAAAQLLTKYDDKISRITGSEAPAFNFPKTYSGKDRLVVTTRQSILHKGDKLRLQAAVLTGRNIGNVKVYYKTFGASQYQEAELKHIGGNVYETYLADNGGQAIEFYYQAEVEGETLQYPATAPQLNLSVVYWQ